jgi:hypothetical protein
VSRAFKRPGLGCQMDSAALTMDAVLSPAGLDARRICGLFQKAASAR